MSTSTLGHDLRKQLIALLDGGQAHATFDDATQNFPPHLRAEKPAGLPYSAWQILEHLRIAQRDILDFSRNTDGTYKHLKWPADYWPTAAAPPDPTGWDASIAAIRADRQAFDQLLHDASDAALVTPFAWGNGQNLLREALLIADHNAYHIGELVILRRLLGAWKK